MKELFLKGGVVMYPILLFSIMGLAVIFERLIYFFSVEKCDYDLMKEELIGYIKRDDINGAKAYCATYNNAVSRVLSTILDNHEMNKKDLEEKVREVALGEIPILEKFMWLLGLTAHVSPLLGLLGTVVGMIRAFNVIAVSGVGKPELLATGISEALITTAAGLIVAIPAMIMYNYLNKKVDVIVNEVEKASVEFVNILGR